MYISIKTGNQLGEILKLFTCLCVKNHKVVITSIFLCLNEVEMTYKVGLKCDKEEMCGSCHLMYPCR